MAQPMTPEPAPQESVTTTDPTICVIPVTGPVTLEYFTGTGLAEICAALGTDDIDKDLVDATDDWGLYAWVGDHSLIDGSPVNERATANRDHARSKNGQAPHPYPLCGPVVFMAFDRRTGESIDFRSIATNLGSTPSS